jgi:membrane protein DedA with SNARE-associated domain
VFASVFHPSSYFGIFLFLVLTGCGMPIPEEVAIVIAGVLSAEGSLRPEFALVACLLGAVVGDCILYAIGYRWGGSLLSLHPKLAKFLHAEREQRFEQAIERHALKVMLLARFLIGIRGSVYVAAGAVRMPFRRFVVYDTLCATIVVGLFFSLSFAFGDEIAHWIRRAEWTATAIVVLLLFAAGGLLYYRHRQLIMAAIFGSQTESGRPPVANPRPPVVRSRRSAE